MNKPSVVFFGSGPVAAKSLELISQDFEISAVVTKPKPSHHRGNFPVIDLSEKLKFPLFTVSNKKELSQLIAAKPFKTETAILIDFGIIVSQDVIDYFPKGIINSHFSLLPEWRGADPITFAILSGQKKTGVSFMLVDEGMDTGKLLAQTDFDMPDKITTPELTDALIEISSLGLKKIVPLWLGDAATAMPQEEVTIAPSTKPSYSRKLTKLDGKLNFNKSANELEREIRAFIDWPKSYTKLADIDVIITSASVQNYTGNSGTWQLKDKQLLMFCGQDALLINELQPAGKRPMSAQAFIAGYGSRLK